MKNKNRIIILPDYTICYYITNADQITKRKYWPSSRTAIPATL